METKGLLVEEMMMKGKQKNATKTTTQREYGDGKVHGEKYLLSTGMEMYRLISLTFYR